MFVIILELVVLPENIAQFLGDCTVTITSLTNDDNTFVVWNGVYGVWRMTANEA